MSSPSIFMCYDVTFNTKTDATRATWSGDLSDVGGIRHGRPGLNLGVRRGCSFLPAD
jgi:hypothetical protein